MAQNDVIELSLVVNVAAVDTATVMHLMQSTTNPTGDPAQDVIDAFLASTLPALWQARTSNDAKLNCIKAQVISPTRGLAVFQLADVDGTVASDSLAPQLGAQHSWQADGWGRNEKGWKTWAGVPVLHHESNNLTATGWAADNAFGNRFQDVITSTGDYEFGVWSQVNSSFKPLGFVRPRAVLKSIRTRRAVSCV